MNDHRFSAKSDRALEILFQDDTASDRWLLGEDVFFSAKLADIASRG